VEERNFLTLPGLKIRPSRCPARTQSLHQVRYTGKRFEFQPKSSRWLISDSLTKKISVVKRIVQTACRFENMKQVCRRGRHFQSCPLKKQLKWSAIRSAAEDTEQSAPLQTLSGIVTSLRAARVLMASHQPGHSVVSPVWTEFIVRIGNSLRRNVLYEVACRPVIMRRSRNSRIYQSRF
jgi:hypothetical protein